MNRKILYRISTLALCFMLTGCCMSHNWKEATCSEPKTCTKCGETDGEALGHTWVEATCTEPKTCSVCGKTEGEALGHTWVEATCTEPKHCSICNEAEGAALEHTLTKANYQKPATCEICSETVGEPLLADFEKYNLTKYIAQLGQKYDYQTLCNDSTHTTVGKVEFSNYQTFDSDEMHPAQEGYAWKSVDITLSFGDKNAWDYGISFNASNEDYYDIVQHDETIYPADGKMVFTVNWNGVDYTECCWTGTSTEWIDWTDNTNPAYGDWEHLLVGKYSVAALVPTDYDGFVWGVISAGIDWGESQHINDIVEQVDNTGIILFRMQ